MTAPALYAYVADKHDLLRAVAEVEFTRLIEIFDAIDEPEPIDRLRAYSRAYIDYALGNPALFRTMFLFPPDAVFAGLAEDVPAASKAFEVPLVAIAEAVASGELPPGTDQRMTALTLWTTTHGVADVLLLGIAFDPDLAEQLIAAVLDTTLAGLRRP